LNLFAIFVPKVVAYKYLVSGRNLTPGGSTAIAVEGKEKLGIWERVYGGFRL